MKDETAPLVAGPTILGKTAHELFEGAEIRLQHETFRRKSDQARRERRRLYRMTKTLNLLVLAVGVLSGLLLAVAIVRGWPVDPARPITRLVAHVDTAEKLLVALIILSTVFASAMGRIMHEGDSLARYRKLRSEAETARVGRYTTLAQRTAGIGTGPALEALEMIRGDLLEDQRAFYLRRADEHRASLAVTGRWSALAIILAGLASMAAVTVLSSEWTQPLLVLGVIAAAISAFAIDREGLNRDRANAEIYGMTAERLGGLAAGVERVRAEIEAGNAQAVVTFADLVSDELQREHRRWAAGLDVTSQLLARLEQRLSDAKARGEGIDLGPRPLPNTLARPADEPAPPAEATAPALSEPPVAVAEAAPEPAPVVPAPAAGLQPAETTPAPAPAPAVSPRDLAAVLAQWTPVLGAVAAVLPSAEAGRAQALLDEIGALATPLAAPEPAGDVVAQAQRLALLLDRGGPISDWLAAGSKVASLVMPPAAILLGAAGIAARLGEDAYRRWVAEVLDAPVPPALVRAAAVDVPVVLAALERAPILAAALQAERRDRDGPALLAFVGRALEGPDALWSEVAGRFDDDRSSFDAGIREISRQLLGPAVSGDLAGITAALAGGAAPDGVRALAGDATAGPLLRTAVLLMHEIRAEAGPAAAGMLVAALQKGQAT